MTSDRTQTQREENWKKSCFLINPKGIFGKHCFCKFQWPRASVWAIFLQASDHPYGLEIPLKDLVQKSLHFWVSS